MNVSLIMIICVLCWLYIYVLLPLWNLSETVNDYHFSILNKSSQRQAVGKRPPLYSAYSHGSWSLMYILTVYSLLHSDSLHWIFFFTKGLKEFFHYSLWWHIARICHRLLISGVLTPWISTIVRMKEQQCWLRTLQLILWWAALQATCCAENSNTASFKWIGLCCSPLHSHWSEGSLCWVRQHVPFT